MANIPEEEEPSSTQWTETFVRRGMALNSIGDIRSPYVPQAYLGPPKFSFAALVSQATTRLQDTDDHLWLMKTEPAYLRRYISSIEQVENIGAPTGVTRKERVVADIINDFRTYWFWKDILGEFTHAESISNQYGDSICPGKPLPEAYDRTLSAIGFLLGERCEDQASSFTSQSLSGQVFDT